MAGRIFERKKRQMPCTLAVDGHHHGGLILDVSPGGLYIQSSAKIKPGDQLGLYMTIPGVRGRVLLQVEVVRKVVVPQRLLKVAHGGVGVRIINAPEAYYQFMDALGITTEPHGGKFAKGPTTPTDSSDPALDSAADAEPEPERAPEPPPQPRFRVRIKQAQGPRSRVVEIAADSEDAAQRDVLHSLGAGWIVLGVERIGAE
jgi:hypothetical protein